MKRVLIAAIIGCCFAGNVACVAADADRNADGGAVAGAAATSHFSAMFYVPGDDETYSNGAGVEFQVRKWVQEKFGLALALGISGWGVEEQNIFYSDPAGYIDINIDGNVALFPFGGSVLFKPINTDSFSLILEGGVRYVLVNSNVDAEIEYFDGFSTLFFSEQVEIDNGFVGVVGAEVEKSITEKFNLVGGIGYQYDISKGDAKLAGEDLGENELEAFYVRLGVSGIF